MIIRRQLHLNNKLPIKKTHDSGMELKPIYKKAAQTSTNPVKKHLPLTTDANSGDRDVDTLLTPINYMKKLREDFLNMSAKERTERNLWRNDEVMEMLYTMQQVKALEKLNDKTIKSENIFKDVEVLMHRNGFKKKSHVQIWTKWKFLKSTYMTSRRNGIIPRMIPPQVYETIHQMISGLNDSSNSTNCSLDGDGSNASGMVISGVEGGVSNAAVTNDEDEDSFGMAHPIFGFRLGMVKSEPADTGYENLENNGSEKDPLENETSNTSKNDKPVKEELQNTEQKINKEPTLPVVKPTEVIHRGRGRPPKNPPVVSSTTTNTPSPVEKNTQLPPLRVAPFAKQVNSENAIAANRPPPPLTMPPTPRIRVANLSDLKNEDAVKFAQPKLMPKPAHHQQQSTPVQTIRLPKEITLQTRTSSIPLPSYPKMKQIPMRKTPYSLRPDRAIPDLEGSLSPPPPVSEKISSKKLEEVESTKNITMQNSNSNPAQSNGCRKRRPEWQDSSMPTKQMKCDREDSPKPNNLDDSKQYSRTLQNVIIDLSSSLRKMQTQMMRDFFNKQNELLEREHRFQLQQDRLIMRAFQEQTQEIMHSVKDLVSSIRTSRNVHSNEGYPHIKVKKSTASNKNPEMDERHKQANEHEDHNEVNDEYEHEARDEVQGQPMIDEHEQVYTDNEEESQEQMEDQEENYQVQHEQEEEIENINNREQNEQHAHNADPSQSQADDSNQDADSSD